MDQELKKKYDALPPDVKEVIDSADVDAKLVAIGKKYSLHIDQIGILGEITGEVMLGDIYYKDFVNSVEERMNIPTDQAINIAVDVNMEIFLKIRQSLEKMYQKQNERPNSTQAAKPVSQTPFYSATKSSGSIQKPPQSSFGQVNTPQKTSTPLNVSIPSTPKYTSVSTPQKPPLGMEKPASTFKPQSPIIQPKPTFKTESSVPTITQQPKPVTPIAPIINPQPKQSIPTIEIKQGQPRPWETAKKEIAQGFVGGKLTQTVALPTERTVMTTKQPEQNQVPQKVDPYREITQ